MVRAQNISFSQSETHFLMLSKVDHTGIMDDHRVCLRAARPLLFSQSIFTPSGRWIMGSNMADIVNLKRFKKRSEKEQSAKQADANRARFGRSKSERVLDEQRSDRASRLLDQHRIDDGDAS
jgi:hypothetical protein